MLNWLQDYSPTARRPSLSAATAVTSSCCLKVAPLPQPSPLGAQSTTVLSLAPVTKHPVPGNQHPDQITRLWWSSLPNNPEWNSTLKRPGRGTDEPQDGGHWSLPEPSGLLVKGIKVGGVVKKKNYNSNRSFATRVTQLKMHYFSGGAFESLISSQLLKKEKYIWSYQFPNSAWGAAHFPLPTQ